MSLIQLRGVGIISPRPLFQNLDLAIHPTDRIGLVAGNGAGKTSLLRCLAGNTEPGIGTITKRRDLRVGFVEQEIPASLLELTLSEAIRRVLPTSERESNAWRIGLILDMLEAPEDLRERTLSALSGGWQRLALIARLWITDPDVLLLDEPTNHLDLQRLEILENWIATQTDGIAMVIASHDRQFLDNCTNRTLFLRPEESRLYAHPFSQARHLLVEDDTARERKLERDGKEAERLRRNAGQLKNVGVNSGSDLLLKKAKQLNQRAEAIEESIRPQVKTRSGTIRLNSRGTHAKVLATLNNVIITTPDGTTLFNTGLLRIFQNDRIVVNGPNGAGKSQLVKLLLRACNGETVPGITVSPSVITGYIDQHMSTLPATSTLFDFIAHAFHLADQQSLSLLAGAGFDVDAQRRPIGKLSPGQKARLGLLALRLTKPNFYLMDEPTNHVDITGQEKLEAEILVQGASGLFVSHDRSFVRAVATRVLQIEKGKLVEIMIDK